MNTRRFLGISTLAAMVLAFTPTGDASSPKRAPEPPPPPAPPRPVPTREEVSAWNEARLAREREAQQQRARAVEARREANMSPEQRAKLARRAERAARRETGERRARSFARGECFGVHEDGPVDSGLVLTYGAFASTAVFMGTEPQATALAEEMREDSQFSRTYRVVDLRDARWRGAC